MSSSVTDETTEIFLESAFFAPLAIAGRARRYGLHTDASQRYERGVDFELPIIGMNRASQLIAELAGGEFGPITFAEKPELLPALKRLNLNKYKSINSGLCRCKRFYYGCTTTFRLYRDAHSAR